MHTYSWAGILADSGIDGGQGQVTLDGIHCEGQMNCAVLGSQNSGSFGYRVSSLTAGGSCPSCGFAGAGVVISNLQTTPPSDVALTLISRNNTYTNAVYDLVLSNQIASAQDLMYWSHTESGKVTLLSSGNSAVPSRFDGGVQLSPQATMTSGALVGGVPPTSCSTSPSTAGSLFLATNGTDTTSLWVCDDLGNWIHK